MAKRQKSGIEVGYTKREKNVIVDVGLRVKEGLRENIERAAEANGNSMNAEIVQRLERSFMAQGLLKDALVYAYGPVAGAMFAEAHVHGMFSFKDEKQKQDFRERAVRWLTSSIDAVPSKGARK
jgi:hypothetical protein